MYDFVDQPVERLCNGGRFLLWAMRGWAGATAQGDCPPLTLMKGFDGVGALSALPSFHTAMTLLDRHAWGPLDCAAMGHPAIDEGEAILLCLWRESARGNPAAACATLELLASRPSALPVAEAMASASRALAEAGFELSDLSHQPLKEEK